MSGETFACVSGHDDGGDVCGGRVPSDGPISACPKCGEEYYRVSGEAPPPAVEPLPRSRSERGPRAR